MNERAQLVIKFIISHILLITGLIAATFLYKNDFSLLLTISQTVLFLLFLAGYWEFTGLIFKKIFCSMAELFIVLSVILRLSSHTNDTPNYIFVIILSFIQIYLIKVLINAIIIIFRKEQSAFEIEFPFKEGNYLVTDGGNSKISRLMNYHYYSPTHKKRGTNNSMLHAADIVKIGGKKPFFPKTNEEYPVFNEKIYSPIEGTVHKVINDIPDNIPYSGNYPYNTGNTVIIKKDNYYLLLGHLKYNSILVKEGDVIPVNEIIGAAGNSGWTERAHLHMQLIKSDTPNYWFGMGVSIQYKGINFYKNRLIGMEN